MEEFSEFTERIVALGEDAIVRQYRIALPEAETLGPALLVYRNLAEMLSQDEILVSAANLRDGLLRETVDADIWTEDFRQQIIQSAVELGRKFHFDEKHARHVAELSQELFRQLSDEHCLDQRSKLILYVAAVLHEIGRFISSASLHKHSMYLILNSELFGLTHHDVQLVALVARYHRRASPKPTHQGFCPLEQSGASGCCQDGGDPANRHRAGCQPQPAHPGDPMLPGRESDGHQRGRNG